MRKNDYLVNILLAAVLALTVLGFLLARTLFPTVVLPAWNIPNLVIVCTAALVFCINSLLGSTLSPIRIVNISSAAIASSMLALNNILSSGFIVVSHN